MSKENDVIQVFQVCTVWYNVKLNLARTLTRVLGKEYGSTQQLCFVKRTFVTIPFDANPKAHRFNHI